MARPAYRDHVTAALTLVLNREGQRRRVAHSYVFKLLARVTPTLEIEGHGARYFIDTHDHGVSLQVFMDGGFDTEIMRAAVEAVERETGRSLRGRTLIDIGANIGTTTVVAVKDYGVTRVIAIEPEPRNIDLLKLTIVANGLVDIVELHQVALSDYDGAAIMELSRINKGDHRIRRATDSGEMGEERRECIEVPVMRFDTLNLDLADVAMAWMDVQGHEGQVLAGALQLLATDIPVVVEYSPYMLKRADGLDLFHRLVAQHFETVVDCRTGRRLAATEITKLTASYPSPVEFTDLLLLHGSSKDRLPGGGERPARGKA